MTVNDWQEVWPYLLGGALALIIVWLIAGPGARRRWERKHTTTVTDHKGETFRVLKSDYPQRAAQLKAYGIPPDQSVEGQP